MMRRCCLFVVLLVTCVACCNTCYAKKGDDHNKDLEKVLFGINNKLSEKERVVVDVLEAAAYLTIDQFGADANQNHLQKTQKSLEILKSYGIRRLPKVEDINVSASPSKHRQYAHSGWSSSYHQINEDIQDETWMGQWEKRKTILEDTVNKVFMFDKKANVPIIGSLFQQHGEKCDSLCAIIYYTHLLGDHEDTETLAQYGYLLPLGGAVDNEDIIDELIYHCEIVFEEQADSFSFINFKGKLKQLSSEYEAIGTIDTFEEIKDNQSMAERVMGLMQENMVKFLAKETFFTEVFALDDVA